VRRFWVGSSGDGIAAAFRAGAEMRNAEFGNLYGHTVWQDTDSGLVPFEYLVNARGENLAAKYLPGSGPAGVFLPIQLAVGIDKEAAEGRGPLFFAPPESAPELPPLPLPKLSEWMERMAAKERKYGLPEGTKREIGVPLHGETSCVKVDSDMRTSVEGLWAIGDTSYAGSAVAGALPSPPGVAPGSGIMFAVVSASWGGPSAARFAAENPASEADHGRVKQLKDDAFAPLQRSNGASPKEAVAAIQDVIAPMKYNLRRTGQRLEEALAGLESVKEMLPELRADDPHYLAACHEVRSMALCAELTLRAALTRTESRGFHFREDHPELDNENWLKWVILRRDGDQVGVSTCRVPIGEYGVRPD
jgi:succinate dehydrogenase/fumarate reductase flavoprotein subunit